MAIGIKLLDSPNDAGSDAAVARGQVGGEEVSPAGRALDELATAAFSGHEGSRRLAPLLERFAAEVGRLAADDGDFELLQVARMDWALCEAEVAGAAAGSGETWAWRAALDELPGLRASPLQRAAARSVAGLFEVFPGRPTWVRNRLSGLVLRLLDPVGPWPRQPESGPAALWELRLVPDESGGFWLARPPIDYPLELLAALDEAFARRFEVARWPALQDLRRARLRYQRAGGRTPIVRLLEFR